MHVYCGECLIVPNTRLINNCCFTPIHLAMLSEDAKRQKSLLFELPNKEKGYYGL